MADINNRKRPANKSTSGNKVNYPYKNANGQNTAKGRGPNNSKTKSQKTKKAALNKKKKKRSLSFRIFKWTFFTIFFLCLTFFVIGLGYVFAIIKSTAPLDIDAVKNGIKYDYNNGLAEGSVNKIKVIKRVAFGYFLLMLVLLLLTWPGIWRMDEFGILTSAVQLFPHFWQNYITSVFYIYALMLFPFPAGVILVQIICISLIIARLVTLCLSAEPEQIRKKKNLLISSLKKDIMIMPRCCMVL